MLKRLLIIMAAIALATGFIAGIGRLCVLRFRSGDVYPALSSLRGDPLGIKAVYDALADIDGIKIERNYRPLSKLRGNRPNGPVTLFYVGADLNGSFPAWDDLRRFAIAGNRVVIIFAPAISAPKSDPKPTASPTPTSVIQPDATPKRAEAQLRRKRRNASDTDTSDPEAARPTRYVLDRLGVQLHFERRWEETALKARSEITELEPELSWHSVAWFEALKPHAKILYSCRNKPVLIEYPEGKGSLVLAADSFFVTNEALRDERAPRLLAALLGPSHEIIFDEFHHGVTENTGVAILMRKYRLEGVFAVLALLAALYVWKASSPLLPRVGSAALKGKAGLAEPEIILGRDASEGFVNLLRRSIPSSQLIAACIEEWNKAFSRERGRFEPPAATHADPVRQFSEIAEAISKQTR